MANDQAILARCGEVFQVTLQYNAGTPYKWCLRSLPSAVALVGTEEICAPANQFGAPTHQVFHFLALEVTAEPISLNFEMFRMFKSHEDSSGHRLAGVRVEVVGCNENETLDESRFVQYSANSATLASAAANVVPPYGVRNGCECVPAMEYGFPAGVSNSGGNASLKYGYPVLKYGYVPCANDGCNGPCIKYGYPGWNDSGNSEPNVKYGYPPMANAAFGQQNVLKYGYPMLKYGYVGCVDDGCNGPCVKYGYPGCVDDGNYAVNVKYGYYPPYC